MAIEVPAVAGKIINLGRAGENLATTVVFDVSSWIEEFGADGTFNLFIQQGTDDYYPQVVTGPTNGKVRWDVVNSNTAIVGLGKCELSYNKLSNELKPEIRGYYNNTDHQFYEDYSNNVYSKKIEPNGLYLYVDLGHSNNLYYYDGMNYISTTTGAENTKQTIVVKSMIYDIMVTNALDVGQGGEMPTAIQSWIDAANAELAQVQNVKQWVVGDNPDPDPGSPSDINNAMYYMKQAQEAANSVIGLGVSSTTTGQAGSNASVTINTQSDPYTLAFTIPKGSQWFTGTVVNGTSASVSGAKINDYYLNTNTSQVWICTGANDSAGTTWASVCNLKGSQGDRGSKWFTGNGNPGSVSGATIDDFYLNKSNGAVWKCTNSTGSSWTSVLNITGPTGPYFTPSVDNSGTISWTNNGGLTNPDSRSIKGPQGDPAPEITNIAINQSNYHMIITLSDGTSYDAGYCRGTPGQDSTGAGTVTSVGISNATNGGLTVSGGPIINSGTITVGHTNILTSAQDTQAVYPIKIDKNGHIKAYGSAVTIPSAADAAPLMDGTVAVGTSTDYAREDHVHPTDTSRAASSHSHGNITNSGDITATAPTIVSGDQIIINDHSASKITNGPTFDGSTTTKYLSQKGTWESIPSGPSPADATPLMDGSTGAVGTSTDYAREDHKHPSDTNKQDKITASGILKGNGSGIVNAATAGTDYIAPPSSPDLGDVLTYNGTNWVASAPATGLPSQTDNSGKFLTTNGTTASWATVDALPSQSGNNGKYLTTNGTAASWAALSGIVSAQGSSPEIVSIMAGTDDPSTLSQGVVYLVYEE